MCFLSFEIIKNINILKIIFQTPHWYQPFDICPQRWNKFLSMHSSLDFYFYIPLGFHPKQHDAFQSTVPHHINLVITHRVLNSRIPVDAEFITQHRASNVKG